MQMSTSVHGAQEIGQKSLKPSFCEATPLTLGE